MRDFQFIHAKEDVGDVLKLASALGLTIRADDPTAKPEPCILENFEAITDGVYSGYRDEWVFGDLLYHDIDAGAYKGRYSQWPRTNCVGVEFYFMGERRSHLVCRLGNGTVSRDVDWYSPADNAVYAAPPEVKEAFDEIRRRLNTRKYVHAGGQRYLLLPGALEKIKQGYLPPFDYIKWPESLVQAR